MKTAKETYGKNIELTHTFLVAASLYLVCNLLGRHDIRNNAWLIGATIVGVVQVILISVSFLIAHLSNSSSLEASETRGTAKQLLSSHQNFYHRLNLRLIATFVVLFNLELILCAFGVLR